MKLLNKFIVLAIVIILVYFSSFFGGVMYGKIFGPSDSFVDMRSLVGTPLAYIFFLTFLFTFLGGEKKYIWLGILLVPAVLFEIYFDYIHIYFPVALGLLGWALGFGILKLKQILIPPKAR